MVVKRPRYSRRCYGQDETILHWPRAITWHFHRREMAELHKQFYGYSAGLSAFYLSMIRSEPIVLLEMLSCSPSLLRDLGLRSGGIRTDNCPRTSLKASYAPAEGGSELGAVEALAR